MSTGMSERAFLNTPNVSAISFTSASVDRKQIIAVAGGKGGVGKTILSASIGIALSQEGFKVVVIDADFGGANLHQALGILSPPITMRNFISGEETDMNKLMLETSVPNVYLLAGAGGTISFSNPQYSVKQRILRNLSKIEADFIILDLGAGSSFNQLDYFINADMGVVVITPEPLAIQDGYQFVKVSLYRKLLISFKKYPELIAFFKNATIPPPGERSKSFHHITEMVAQFGELIHQEWNSIVRTFKPVVIMNMVESEKDLFEGMALQIASRDILNIEIEEFEYVQYDDGIRRAAKLMQPELLMRENCGAAQDIAQFVNHAILKKGKSTPTFRKHLPKHKATTVVPDCEEDVICSVHCNLWDNCSAQRGGFPCRIRIVGFMNQK